MHVNQLKKHVEYNTCPECVDCAFVNDPKMQVQFIQGCRQTFNHAGFQLGANMRILGHEVWQEVTSIPGKLKDAFKF